MRFTVDTVTRRRKVVSTSEHFVIARQALIECPKTVAPLFKSILR